MVFWKTPQRKKHKIYVLQKKQLYSLGISIKSKTIYMDWIKAEIKFSKLQAMHQLVRSPWHHLVFCFLRPPWHWKPHSNLMNCSYKQLVRDVSYLQFIVSSICYLYNPYRPLAWSQQTMISVLCLCLSAGDCCEDVIAFWWRLVSLTEKKIAS